MYLLAFFLFCWSIFEPIYELDTIRSDVNLQFRISAMFVIIDF